MNIEIERKFLVVGPFKHLAVKQLSIRQGYLSIDPERNVRIRTANNNAFITIKGKTNESGMSRFEFEKEITLEEAELLFKLCIGYLIEKTRYHVPFEGHLFEVDIFAGANEGLILAEVELKSEAEDLKKPDWIGEEVTGIKRYYNSHLIQNPFNDRH